MELQLDSFSDEELLAALSAVANENKLYEWFDPEYPYDWQKDYFDAGRFASQRLLMAANGVGKSQTICAEFAMHITGRYPSWWKGVRFDYGGWEAWIGSIDNDMQKRGPQRALLGRSLDDIGTGLVPRDAIMKDPELRQAGVKSVVDTLVVRHASGRPVVVKWLTFEQGWRKWQSGDPKIVLWDEEPDDSNVEQKDILSEVLTRLVRNNGIFMVGYTPLLGETQLTSHFMNAEPGAPVYTVSASWDDAPHMTEETRRQIEAQYPEHQRDARTRGIPMLGEGRIFRMAESAIVVDPFEIPEHWARICGIDIGLAHPAACAWLAWNRDNNVVYLYDAWRGKNVQTKEHCDIIKSRGRWIPVAWPHDGEKRDPKSGERFADTYRGHKVRMLGKSARYPKAKGGSQAQWPVIEDVREAIDEARFFVFRTCKPWLEEYRSYHTKDGKIVARKDDTLKASFYAYMMLRYSISKREGERSGRRRRRTAQPLTTSVAKHE